MNSGEQCGGSRDPSPQNARPFEVVGRKRVLQGPIFDLEEVDLRLSSGRSQHAFVVRHPGAVAVAALDAAGRLLLVRQVRVALLRQTLEIPAGRLEAGETPLAAARRELEEETGWRAQELLPLVELEPAPGFCDERIFVFEARGLSPAGADRLDPDEDEELESCWMPLPEVVALRPADAKTLIAALLLQGRRASATR